MTLGRLGKLAQRAERAETWLYTGPLGRVFAFAGDFAGAWLRWARGLDPSTRPERRVAQADRSKSERGPSG